MSGLNRDAIIAMILLVVWTVFFWSSFDIRIVNYGTMEADVWPKGILVALYILTAIYLFQSLKQGKPEGPSEPFSLSGFLQTYRNPLWCFAIYFVFLITLPFFGILIGGTLLVFALLTVFGDFSPRHLVLHAVIAALSIGGMWSIFTFALGVILPRSSFIPGI